MVNSPAGGDPSPPVSLPDPAGVRSNLRDVFRWAGIPGGLLIVIAAGGWGVFRDPRVNLVIMGQFLFWWGAGMGAGMLIGVLRLVRAEWRRPFARAGELLLAGSLGLLLVVPVLAAARHGIHPLLTLPEHESWPALHPGFGVLLEGGFVLLTLLVAGGILARSFRMDDPWRARANRPREDRFGRRSAPDHGEDSKASVSLPAAGQVAFLAMGCTTLALLGWGYGMNLVPHWNSTLFASSYVATSLYAGTALMLNAALGMRTLFGLGPWITPHHVGQLGKFMVGMVLLWFYFRFCEYLTVWYSEIPSEIEVLHAHTFGTFPWVFSGQVVLNFVVPLVYFSFPRLRRCPRGAGIVSGGILLGLLVERVQMFAPVHLESAPVLSGYSLMVGGVVGLLFPILLTAVLLVGLWWAPVLTAWEWHAGRRIRGRRTVGETTKATYALVDPEAIPPD